MCWARARVERKGGMSRDPGDPEPRKGGGTKDSLDKGGERRNRARERKFRDRPAREEGTLLRAFVQGEGGAQQQEERQKGA